MTEGKSIRIFFNTWIYIYIYKMKNLPWVKKTVIKISERTSQQYLSEDSLFVHPDGFIRVVARSSKALSDIMTQTQERMWLTNTLLLNMTLLWISQHYSVTPVQQHISECSFNKLKKTHQAWWRFFSLLWHWPQGLRVPYFLVLSNFKCMCVSVFTPQIYFTLGLPCTDWLND